MSDNVLPLPRPNLDAAKQLFGEGVSGVSEYRDAEGALAFLLVRHAEPPKLRCARRTGGAWAAGDLPAVCPLYNLPALVRSAPSDEVWLASTEEMADTLTRLGRLCTVIPGAKTDVSPLADRNLVFWPHWSAAAHRAAVAAGKRLCKLARTVEHVSMRVDPPDVWIAEHPAARLADLEAFETENWKPKLKAAGQRDAKAAKKPAEKKIAAPIAATPEPEPTPEPESDATITEAADGSTLIETEHSSFMVNGRGVYLIAYGKRGEQQVVRICSELRVLAKTRMASSRGWGLLLEWRDPDGRRKQWAMPRQMLEGDTAALRRELADAGLEFGAAKKGKDRFEEFISSWPVKARARCTDRVGWCGGCYAMGDRVLGAPDGDERVVYQSDTTCRPAFGQAGRLKDWRQHVARLCDGNSRLMFAVSAAFAGPLVAFAGNGGDSGGFNLRGPSSCGKTSALLAAASVWGGKDYLRQWRTTVNGLEALAAAHNDGLLVLDELAQVRPDEAGTNAYLLANGQGKTRMDKSLNPRPPPTWRLLFLSAGELSLADHMLAAGQKAKAGQELRLADLPADAGQGMGCVEALNGCADSGELVNRIRDASSRYFGTAGVEWLEWLVRQGDLKDRVDKGIARFLADTAAMSAENRGQLERVARRFGLVAVAGELATEAGITGWSRWSAWQAVITCFKAWYAAQGSICEDEETKLLEHVRAWIERNSQTRFGCLDTDENKERVIDRVGFRRNLGGGAFEADRYEWLVFRSAWRRDLLQGIDPQWAEQILLARGWLVPDRKGAPTIAIRSPIGIQRFYVLGPKVFQEDTDA